MLEERGGMNGEFSREFQNLVKYFPDKSVNKSTFRMKTRTNVLTPHRLEVQSSETESSKMNGRSKALIQFSLVVCTQMQC